MKSTKFLPLREKRLKVMLFLVFWLVFSASFAQQYDTISEKKLKEKIAGYWIGQLVGNYMGFPFEFVYCHEPVPVLIDRYYNATDSTDLKMNRHDRRAYINIFADALGGAWSDDDTDIEFTTLHAVERYGLDITYPEITQAWKTHINRFIWVSNRKARNLMEQGLMPPETGKKENNPYWYAIDPQLVNEIWSVFYPGMVKNAVQRALWSAKITSDDWGTHPTLFYAALYSAAFFETDVQKLYNIGMAQIPDSSPFKQGLKDVKKWHKKHKNWRKTRQLISEHYLRYPEKVENEFFHHVSAMVNGLCGAMAILYGKGDFMKTTAIAVSAGFDCDNQAATCAGLIGVMHGKDAIPERLTKNVGLQTQWNEPFNNMYINYSRDKLPNITPISEIVDRIAAIAAKAIVENGGQRIEKNRQIFYKIERK